MSSFISNVIALSSGTIIAQAIGILAAPVLTRLFAPEAFGALGFFMALTGVVGSVSCLRYELAIMLPRQDEKAANLFAGSLLLSALTTLLALIIVAAAGHRLLARFGAEHINATIWLVPPMIFAVGTFSAANYWCSRTRRFRSLAVVRVVNALVTNALNLAMVFFSGLGNAILILSAFIGQCTTNIILFAGIWKADGPAFRNGIDFKTIRSLFRRYARFPKYELWSGITVDLSLKLPIFAIAYFFSAKQLGYFVFVQTIVKVPFNFIGDSIAKVFFQKAADIRNRPLELSKWVENVFLFLTACFMCPALLISVIGKDAFTVVFGPNWQEAGIYAQILIFSVFVEFVTAPLSSLFNVLERQKEALRFNLFSLSVRCLALVIGGLTANIFATIAIYVMADIIARTIKFTYIFKQLQYISYKLIGAVVKAMALASPFLVCTVVLKFAFDVKGVTIVLVAASLTTINYAVLIHQNNLFKTFITNRPAGIS